MITVDFRETLIVIYHISSHYSAMTAIINVPLDPYIVQFRFL